MIWFLLALISALMLGGYDVCKKQSLRDNAVVPVLLINTAICSLLFLPLLLLSAFEVLPAGSHWYVPSASWDEHRYLVFKAALVLSSWLCGYFAIKHLPLTLVGPINATRPVMTLLGALLIFGERFNLWQWVGILLAILAFFLLSRSGKKEGIVFSRNRWIYLLLLAAVLGACSGLYDKYLLAPVTAGGLGMKASFVQAWFNIYQSLFMLLIFGVLWWPNRSVNTPFRWRWTIVGISLLITAADLFYYFALSHPDALIAIVSMTRRSSVLVSFAFGVFLLRERNVRSKALDLLLVFLSMVCLCIGALSAT